MDLDLRCSAKLHAIVVAPNRVEVKCGSRFCGAGRGVVVLHQFDTTTGNLVATKKFSEPLRDNRTERNENASR